MKPQKIKKMIALFSLLMISNYTMAANYHMYVPIEKTGITFGNKTEGNNGEGQEPGETCSNSFAYVDRNSFDVTYGSGIISFNLKNTNGYDSYSSMAGKKYVKLLVVTRLEGISSHTAGALIAEGTPLQYQVLSGESIRMVVTPTSYSMETLEECAKGVPVEVINTNYNGIISLPAS